MVQKFSNLLVLEEVKLHYITFSAINRIVTGTKPRIKPGLVKVPLCMNDPFDIPVCHQRQKKVGEKWRKSQEKKLKVGKS